MGWAAGIKDAKLQNAGYIKAGHYLVRIDRVLAGKNRENQDKVAIEMTVLHRFADGPVPEDGIYHSPGERCADVISQSNGNYFFPRLLGFLTSILGGEIPPNDREETIYRATNSDPTLYEGAVQPLSGLIMELVGYNKVTKKGTHIINVSWKGQITVARLRELVPAEQLGLLMNSTELAALEARQKEASATN